MSHVQSTEEGKTREERQRREEAERRAQEADERAEQILFQYQTVINTVQRADPEAAKLVVEEATKAASTVEVEQLKRRIEAAEQREAEQIAAQKAYQDHVNWWNSQANNMGLNPYDQEFQAAINVAWQSGNGTIAMQALMKLSGKTQQAQMHTSEPDYVGPPSGGSPRPRNADEADIAKIKAQYDKEIAEAIGEHDETAKGHIRMKYRKIFQSKGLPDIPG